MSHYLFTQRPRPADLTYITEQYPPFNYEEHDQLQGIAVELLDAVTATMGDRLTEDKIRLMPWTDGYQTTLNQTDTVLFSTVRLPEREASFKWVGPIYTEQKVLFASRDRTMSINRPEDLRVAASPQEAVTDADVICTATTSSTPVFADVDLKPGVHINGIGSYTPAMG